MGKVLEMIERVRAGEDAEAVITGENTGKDKNGYSGGLGEEIERFLRNDKERGV